MNSVLAARFLVARGRELRALTRQLTAVAAVACCVLSASAAADAPLSADDYIKLIENPQQPDRKGLDALTLEQIMQRFSVPGVSVAVIKDFKIHWTKSYGVRDVTTGEKVDTKTLFQAASISKPVTAMAVLKAAQDGKFSMDQDINTILSSWKIDGAGFTSGRAVTVRSLASHTSGLGDGFGFPGYDPGKELPTPVQILKGEKPSNVGAVRMERAPSEDMKYSGGGYVVLQLMLTDALNQPFEQILRRNVLEPIGMTNSAFEQPLSAERDKNAARGHDGGGRAMGPKWHVYPELAPAGLWTTAEDLAKFAIEVQRSAQGESNKVLSPAFAREMLRPAGTGDMAVGFAVEHKGQGWYMQHTGGNWGFVCLLQAHHSKGYGVVVMTNAGRGGAVMNEIKERVERAYGWDSLDKAVPR